MTPRPSLCFERIDDPVSGLTSYLCDGARFEPSRTTAANAGGLHVLATNRGARRDLTALAAPGATNPRQSVRDKLDRVVAEISQVSRTLGAALAGIRCESVDGRVLCWLPDRAHGFAIVSAEKHVSQASLVCDPTPST